MSNTNIASFLSWGWEDPKLALNSNKEHNARVPGPKQKGMKPEH